MAPRKKGRGRWRHGRGRRRGRERSWPEASLRPLMARSLSGPKPLPPPPLCLLWARPPSPHFVSVHRGVPRRLHAVALDQASPTHSFELGGILRDVERCLRWRAPLLQNVCTCKDGKWYSRSDRRSSVVAIGHSARKYTYIYIYVRRSQRRGINWTDQPVDRPIDQSTARLTDLGRTTTDDRPSDRATVQNTNQDATHACTHSQGTHEQTTYIYIYTRFAYDAIRRHATRM
jgi:hypothetical protein